MHVSWFPGQIGWHPTIPDLKSGRYCLAKELDEKKTGYLTKCMCNSCAMNELCTLFCPLRKILYVMQKNHKIKV